jgi:phage antirepressor YoqD-like protein
MDGASRMNLIQSNAATIKTINSSELRDLINKCRLGVEQPIRLNKLNEKIVDELEFEHYTKSVVQNINNTESVIYHLTVEQCTLIGMRESKTVRRSILAKLKELESQQAPAIPQTYAAALIEAGRLAQVAEEQAEQLAIAAPKVAFVEKYVESTGNKGFREVAKLLKIKEPVLRAFLSDNKIMYQLGGNWTAYQNHIDAGRFHVSTGTKNEHAYNTAKFTPKGIAWIIELMERV